MRPRRSIASARFRHVRSSTGSRPGYSDLFIGCGDLTSLEVIVAVVVECTGFARISVSPIQPQNFFPGGGGSAVTLIPKVSAA